MLLSRIEALLPSVRAITLVSIGIAIGLQKSRSTDGSLKKVSSSSVDAGFHHHEDIKAAIRKRYGSLAAFEVAKGLPKESVRDVLRGRASERIAIVIADELGLGLAEVLRITRPSVDRWISGGAHNNFRFRKARTERQS